MSRAAAEDAAVVVKIQNLRMADPLLDWPEHAAQEWTEEEADMFYDSCGGWEPPRRHQTVAAPVQLVSRHPHGSEQEPEPEPESCPRVFAWSDIHVDYGENWRCCQGVSATEYQNDVLILAGDVSDDMAKLRETFELFKQKFAEVFFVPGNHDLWIRPGRWKVAPQQPLGGAAPPLPDNSLAKLQQILDLCRELGVHTSPRAFGPGGRLAIVPLFAWYHRGFDTEPEITGWQGIPPIEEAMMDYQLVKFPSSTIGAANGDESAARYFDLLNERRVGELLPDAAVAASATCKAGEATSLSSLSSSPWDSVVQMCRTAVEQGGAVISFSHFLPRIELLPEKRFLFLPTLAHAVGSRYLQQRVEELRSSLHVFGHTHFGWDATVDGVRYVQAALCYPQERSMRAKSIAIGPKPGVGQQPLEVWDGTALLPYQRVAYWSTYYATHERTPENTNDLAPYVARA